MSDVVLACGVVGDTWHSEEVKAWYQLHGVSFRIHESKVLRLKTV